MSRVQLEGSGQTARSKHYTVLCTRIIIFLHYIRVATLLFKCIINKKYFFYNHWQVCIFFYVRVFHIKIIFSNNKFNYLYSKLHSVKKIYKIFWISLLKPKFYRNSSDLIHSSTYLKIIYL